MDTNDILYIIEKECSSELVDILREFISDLKEKADYTTQKINTDLDSYESELNEYNSLCSDLRDGIKRLKDYINNSTRLDRNHIVEELKCMEKEIINVN